MRIATSLVVIGSLLVASGCQTRTTSARFSSAQEDVQTCISKIAEAEVIRIQNQPKFTDSKDMLIYLMLQKMNQTNVYQPCTAVYIAMIQADKEKVSRLISGGTALGGIGLGILGVKVLADGITDLAAGGSSSGDIWNVNGSRVVNKSGNYAGQASSSGTGLGLGNVTTVGAGQGVGGIDPRTTPINGDVSEINTGSNSGDNGSVTPIEGNDPTILPVP